MLKRSWIVCAFAMLLGCSMAAYGAMGVGTRARPEPKGVVIAKDLQLAEDEHYYSDPIDAVGYDAVSISADWNGEVNLEMEVLAHNAAGEPFRPIYEENSGSQKFFAYFNQLEPARGRYMQFRGLRAPEIQVHLFVSGAGTANVSIYME